MVGPRYLAWAASLLLLLVVVPAVPAQAAVSVSRAEVSGSALRIEGTALADRDITVDGVIMGRSDGGGRFKVQRDPYTPPPDCTVDVNDGSATPRTVTLSGCTVTPLPPPATQPAPSPLSPADGATVTTPVTLSWSQVLDPASLNGGYNWRVSTSPTFGTLVARDSTTPATTQDTVGGLTVGTYHWQVQAVSADLVSSDWSAARSFSVTGPGPGALAAPVLDPLISGGAYHPMESFPFSWSAVPGAASYLAEVSDDPTFPAPVDVKVDNIPGTSSGLKFDDSLIGAWNLRVRAVDSAGTLGAPSNVRTFTVSYDAPIGPPPTLAAPADGVTVELPVTLDWNDVENPQQLGYLVQVASNPDFTNEEAQLPFRTASEVSFSDLTPGTKYWRVAHSEGDASPTTAALTDWSEVRSFTVADTAPRLTSLTLLGGATSRFSGTEQVAEVQLSAVAPAGGAVVDLASSHPIAGPVPATVTVPAGSASTQFRFFWGQVTAPTAVTITATYGGASATASMTVNPPSLKEVGPSPNSVTGGSPASAFVALNGAAPADGAVVSLTSDSTLATPPSSVTVPAGSFSQGFAISTSPVTMTTTVTITASWKGQQITHPLTLTPGVPPADWTVDPPSTTGSEGSFARVAIAAVQSTDTTFTLSSSHPDIAWLPPTVTVPAGSPHAGVIVSSRSPTVTTEVTLSVSGAGVTKTATLTVHPIPAAPLPAPSLLAPAEGARWAPNVTRTFDWTDVTGAGTYTLQVSSSSAFTAVAVERTVTASTVNLSFGTEGTRYWRVRAHDTGGSPGAWSATRSFRIKR